MKNARFGNMKTTNARMAGMRGVYTLSNVHHNWLDMAMKKGGFGTPSRSHDRRFGSVQ
jgi:hypothetical protein